MPTYPEPASYRRIPPHFRGTSLKPVAWLQGAHRADIARWGVLGGSAPGGVVKAPPCGLDHDELGAGVRMKARGQRVGHATQSMCMNGAIR